MQINELAPNIPLKISILEAGLTQRDLSNAVQIGESVLSMAVRGRYVLDAQQRQRIREVLMQRGASDPFPEDCRADQANHSSWRAENG